MADLFKFSPRGQRLTHYYQRSLCDIDAPGHTACADHCHRPSMRIRVNGERSTAGIWTVGNRHCQIMGNYAVRSKSMADLRVPLAGMHSRLVRLQGQVT